MKLFYSILFTNNASIYVLHWLDYIALSLTQWLLVKLNLHNSFLLFYNSIIIFHKYSVCERLILYWESIIIRGDNIKLLSTNWMVNFRFILVNRFSLKIYRHILSSLFVYWCGAQNCNTITVTQVSTIQ